MEYVLGFVLVLILILLVRAMLFRPRPQAEVQPFAVNVDGDRAVAHLAQMIRCRTVSHDEVSLDDEAEFERFRELLKELYPRVHGRCELQRVGRTGLLYRWPGKSPEKPTVYMAHYDVVPAAEEDWEHPPFAGVIADDCLWGRGTLDTKGTLCGIMEATEHLIAQGFVPENDIYLSFAGDEEVNGTGAAEIVDYLARHGVQPHMVLDEGGAIVEGAVPGVPGKYALVGTGEKGKLHLRLSVRSNGGHGSAPPPHSPVGVLAQAVCRVEKRPLQFHLAAPVREMFATLGRHAGFGMRLFYANLGLFAPLLNLAAKRMGGEINALVRTTVAFTKMQASAAVNVFPPMASVEADVRLMEGSTRDSVIQDIKRRVRDPNVEVEVLETIEVMPFSQTGTEPWQRLEQGIRAVWPGTMVSPYLMIAASDSRQYTKICSNVLRFSAMELSNEERKLIHGTNERIPLDKVATTVKFFICMMMKS